MPYQQEQLQFLMEIADLRTPLLNAIFLFLNYFDSIYFFLFLVPLVMIGISSKWGIRLFYLMYVSDTLNGGLKLLLDLNRPSTDWPGLGLIPLYSPGYPSGGAQTAFLLGTLLIYYVKTRWAWVLGIVYILLISFSRMYLGVHYPMDILGGWINGAILAVLLIRLRDPIEALLRRLGIWVAAAIGLVLPVTEILVIDIPKIKINVFGVILLILGSALSLRFHLFLEDAKRGSEGMARALFAVFPVIAAFAIFPGEFMPFKQFLIALWASLIASPLYRRLVPERRWFY